MREILSVSMSESELYSTISRAINYDIIGEIPIRIDNLIKDASKEDINDSLEKFEIKDIEKFLRTKKLKNLNK